MRPAKPVISANAVVTAQRLVEGIPIGDVPVGDRAEALQLLLKTANAEVHPKRLSLRFSGEDVFTPGEGVLLLYGVPQDGPMGTGDSRTFLSSDFGLGKAATSMTNDVVPLEHDERGHVDWDLAGRGIDEGLTETARRVQARFGARALEVVSIIRDGAYEVGRNGGG